MSTVATPIDFKQSFIEHNGTRVLCLSPADGSVSIFTSQAANASDHPDKRATASGSIDTSENAAALYTAIRTAGQRYGGVLLRGFEPIGAGGLQSFSAGFGKPVTAYEFGSTPRKKIEKSVFSSTEYPASQWIDQHNEQSYTLNWPSWVWFYCDIAAQQGGETPVADSRRLYTRIDPRIVKRFTEHGVMYVRNFGNGLDVPWEQVFGTDDRAQVETYCRANRIVFEWLDDGESLRTTQICQAVHRHPVTGEWVWFNQAHLFHLSNLPVDVREAMLEVVEVDRLPRNACFGDGAPIDIAMLDEIRGVYQETMLRFPWQAGDILALDNVLMSHGRAPFSGARRVLVAMTE